MRLYLVQHGEAVDKTVDPERPLSEQGEQDVAAMAAQLGAAGVRVERVWHSGKRRAGQTAAQLAKAVLGGRRAEAIAGINPGDDVAEFARDADVWEQDTLVVGHLPFMGRLVSHLLTGNADAALVAFRPGSVVCLTREADGDWVLQWMLRPRLLD